MIKTDCIWKENWAAARQHHIDWWEHKGLVLWLTAPKDSPWEKVPAPAEPRDLEERWFDAEYRTRRAEYDLSRVYFGGDSFPLAGSYAGAGDLAAYLGSPIRLSPETVWYDPCIADPPERHPPLRLDRSGAVYRKAVALADRMVAVSGGRFLVTPPDIVENIDILSAMRGPQTLLMDMVDRPAWVEERVAQINAAFFEVFDAFYRKTRDENDGSTFVFNLWGPGKTCKVQCDACSMFSPAMFARFVLPALTEQCEWLDYAMYHLDGEDCLPHLDLLLGIEPLQAIEWTPRYISRGEDGGQPKFYDLYRRILRGGKSVQAIGVKYDDVIPLLDAVGAKGMFITTSAQSEAAARRLEERVRAYRR